MGCGAVIGQAMGTSLLMGGIVFLVFGLMLREFADNRMNWATITGIAMLGSLLGIAFLVCSCLCCCLCIGDNQKTASSKSSTNQPQASFNQSSMPYGGGSALYQNRR